MKPPLEPLKAIALFTPGGDFAYCKDTEKQKHWHVHLCSALQEALHLSETPHFLLQAYKATVDVYWDPLHDRLQVTATAMPAVLKYRGLLNHLFQIPGTQWQVDKIQEDLSDPSFLQQYRQEFPQLWKFHDLVIPVTQRSTSPDIFVPTFYTPYPEVDAMKTSSRHRDPKSPSQSLSDRRTPAHVPPQSVDRERYILRLFVSHKGASTESALRNLHRVLERSHLQPYTLQVIDISKYPEQAERDQVTATPTLLRVQPQPTRRIVGNLENDDQLLHLLVGLDLADYA
jgi:circadian clock protein KaiB